MIKTIKRFMIAIALWHISRNIKKSDMQFQRNRLKRTFTSKIKVNKEDFDGIFYSDKHYL